MQLIRRSAHTPSALKVLLFVVASVLGAARSRSARGASDTDAPDRTSTDSAGAGASNRSAAGRSLVTPGEPQDTATERAALELGGYNDSDHVSVLTPSIALSIENTSGASLAATYLVDVVSAASVDIVSTASSRWNEVRQAGSIVAGYKPHDFGIDVGTSFSSEPDYLSYGAYAMVTKDFDQKNWTLFFGYGFTHDTIGRCGDYGTCTPF
ncbi:MAG: DUF3570 domain-containing protein, partial [Polyangiaceae bacterium]